MAAGLAKQKEYATARLKVMVVVVKMADEKVVLKVPNLALHWAAWMV